MSRPVRCMCGDIWSGQCTRSAVVVFRTPHADGEDGFIAACQVHAEAVPVLQELGEDHTGPAQEIPWTCVPGEVLEAWENGLDSD